MPALYLLDTNTVSAVMADHPKVKAKLSLQPGQVVTCAIVRGEIRYGLERLPVGKRRANLETKASAVFATLPIEPIMTGAGDIYGPIRRSLELKRYRPPRKRQAMAARIRSSRQARSGSGLQSATLPTAPIATNIYRPPKSFMVRLSLANQERSMRRAPPPVAARSAPDEWRRDTTHSTHLLLSMQHSWRGIGHAIWPSRNTA
jgi:predicted nucleic acid-binding protein